MVGSGEKDYKPSGSKKMAKFSITQESISFWKTLFQEFVRFVSWAPVYYALLPLATYKPTMNKTVTTAAAISFINCIKETDDAYHSVVRDRLYKIVFSSNNNYNYIFIFSHFFTQYDQSIILYVDVNVSKKHGEWASSAYSFYLRPKSSTLNIENMLIRNVGIHV